MTYRVKHIASKYCTNALDTLGNPCKLLSVDITIVLPSGTEHTITYDKSIAKEEEPDTIVHLYSLREMALTGFKDLFKLEDTDLVSNGYTSSLELTDRQISVIEN